MKWSIELRSFLSHEEATLRGLWYLKYMYRSPPCSLATARGSHSTRCPTSPSTFARHYGLHGHSLGIACCMHAQSLCKHHHATLVRYYPASPILRILAIGDGAGARANAHQRHLECPRIERPCTPRGDPERARAFARQWRYPAIKALKRARRGRTLLSSCSTSPLFKRSDGCALSPFTVTRPSCSTRTGCALVPQQQWMAW